MLQENLEDDNKEVQKMHCNQKHPANFNVAVLRVLPCNASILKNKFKNNNIIVEYGYIIRRITQ
jgi:hypothetical protein